MTSNFQKRRPESEPDPKLGLARRATDTDLRGMQIDENDNDEVWRDWQDALDRQERDAAATSPSPLE